MRYSREYGGSEDSRNMRVMLIYSAMIATFTARINHQRKLFTVYILIFLKLSTERVIVHKFLSQLFCRRRPIFPYIEHTVATISKSDYNIHVHMQCSYIQVLINHKIINSESTSNVKNKISFIINHKYWKNNCPLHI